MRKTLLLFFQSFHVQYRDVLDTVNGPPEKRAAAAYFLLRCCRSEEEEEEEEGRRRRKEGKTRGHKS